MYDAGMTPANWPGFVGSNVVDGSGVPSTVIWEPLTKFVPLTVMGSGADPALAEVGVNPVTVGAGFTTFTLKVAVPPPGEAFEIVPFNVAALCVSLILRAKVTVLPETTPEALPSEPVVPATKPVPETVTVAGPDPAGIEAGLTFET